MNSREDPGGFEASPTSGATKRKPPEGFEPPTCSSFGAGVLRLHIRNCRSAGLSYGGATARKSFHAIKIPRRLRRGRQC